MDETIETYNKAASAYAAKFDTIGSRKSDIGKAFALVGVHSEPLVVEWGCGNGRDAKVILEYTKQYIGIDASSEMITLAKKSLPEADLRVADMATFEIPDGTDIIFSFASLLHFSKESIASVLKKTHTKLSDGGVVYISLKKAPYEKRVMADSYGPRTFYFYQREDIEEILDGLYEVVLYEEQIQKEIPWFTIALKKRTQ